MALDIVPRPIDAEIVYDAASDLAEPDVMAGAGTHPKHPHFGPGCNRQPGVGIPLKTREMGQTTGPTHPLHLTVRLTAHSTHTDGVADDAHADAWRADHERRAHRAAIDTRYFAMMPTGVRLRANQIRAAAKEGAA